jgi:hypothetical protein
MFEGILSGIKFRIHALLPQLLHCVVTLSIFSLFVIGDLLVLPQFLQGICILMKPVSHKTESHGSPGKSISFPIKNYLND